MKTLLVATLMLAGAGAIAAADITGTWSASVVLDAGSGIATLTLKQTGDAVTGTYMGTLGEAKVAGTVKGNQVELSFDGGPAGKITFTGTMDGASKFKGSCEYGLLGKGTFTAEKK